MTRALGWRPPASLGRHHRGTRRRLTVTELAGLPPVIDLSPLAPEVYDQMALGSCVGQAVAKGLELLLEKSRRDLLTPRRFIPSRLALYFGARQALGTTDEDSGAIIADCLEHARKVGFADESLWSYAENIGQFASHPPWNYYDAAAHSKLVNFEPLAHDEATLHWELACGHPVLAGMLVDEGFESPQDGVIVPGGDKVGGHAVAIVGIDALNRRVRVMNSWGTDWGDRGLAWLPLDVLLDPSITGEIHALRSVRVKRDLPPIAERAA